MHGQIRQAKLPSAGQFGIQPLMKSLKMVLGHCKLTSFECATILSAALQLFAIKLPLHLNTNSFQKSKLKLSALNVIFRTSPSIKCPITSEIICTTSVSFSSANPVQAFAKRKSPLNTAILLPNSISSWYDLLQDVMLDRFTIPVCTKLAEIEKTQSKNSNSLSALVLRLLPHHSHKGLCSLLNKSINSAKLVTLSNTLRNPLFIRQSNECTSTPVPMVCVQEGGI